MGEVLPSVERVAFCLCPPQSSTQQGLPMASIIPPSLFYLGLWHHPCTTSTKSLCDASVMGAAVLGGQSLSSSSTKRAGSVSKQPRATSTAT